METFTSQERGKEAKRAGKDTANQHTQGQGKAPILKQKGYHPLDVTYKHCPFVHATAVLVISVTPSHANGYCTGIIRDNGCVVYSIHMYSYFVQY